MRIAIFGMTFPETSKNYLQHLIKKIENENSQVIIEEQFLKTFKKHISFKRVFVRKIFTFRYKNQ